MALSLVERDPRTQDTDDQAGWEVEFVQDNAPSRRRLSEAEREVLAQLLHEPPRQ